jgi:transcriptional regulator with XRE-family HTH domain
MIDGSDDSLSAREVFGTELAARRERSGWTLVELSDRTKYDASYLQRLEKGDRLGTIYAAGVLDQVYGSGDLIKNLWRLAKKEAEQGRYRGFFDLEAEALIIQVFSVDTVPGMLQTSGYAGALLGTNTLDDEELLAKQVRFRINRQHRLTDPKPLQYRALLDEAVIRRRPQDPDVWAEQLKHLIGVAQQPNVSLQVMRFGTGLHNLMGSGLQLLGLPSGQTVAYVESSRTGRLIDEVEEVVHLRVSYDRLRDAALSPSESLDLLRATLEDHFSCLTPSQT